MHVSHVGDPVVFFTQKHQWVVGKVLSYDALKNTYSCCTTEPEFIKVDSVSSDSNNLFFPRSDLLYEDVDDFLNLTELHEASLFLYLKERYLRDIVYTNIGPILIALNPFSYSIPWYSDSKMEDYVVERFVIQNNRPHLWATAHNAYWDMKESGQNQSILISGESGAGKTEAAKILLKYVGVLSTKNGKCEHKEIFTKISKRILASSPILESFGNAKTICNDNSSRFGKFLRVQFDSGGNLVGCHVTKYLLERSRIVSSSKGERVYHSFYQLAQGPLAKAFFLQNPKVYNVLNAGECFYIDGVDDALGYAATKQAMDDVGITYDEQMSIWRIVAGIIFLQNTNFVETEEAVGRVTRIDSNLLPMFTRACELWGVKEEYFMKELVSTSIITQKEQTLKPLNKVMALDTRDSICKSLYDWLFDWIVVKINETTNQETLTAQWMGLLDIFGFENFQRNSFEQLCINLANEVIQAHYNEHIFTLDMRECQEEGIDTAHVNFSDNKECVDLLMGRFGIFRLLDEECAINGSESNFLQKLVCAFGSTKSEEGNAYFLRAKGRALDNHFIVRHYAADVQYNIDGFLNKNRDTLKPAMRHVLLQSKVPLIALIVPRCESNTASKETVGGYFIKQLIELISVINSTNPHWIRCIKPNASKQPRVFSGGLVLEQLRSAGVLETIKVRKAGYPIRFGIDEMVKRYHVLRRFGLCGKEACKQIMQDCGIDATLAQLGKTKVFIKSEGLLELNHYRDLATLKFALILQAAGRGSLARGKVFALYLLYHRQRILEERRIYEENLKKERELEEARRLAEKEKCEKQERLFRERLNKAAVSIQRVVRGFLSRKKFFVMFLSILRAREEYRCDDELRKYRDHELIANQRICALEAWLSELEDLPYKSTGRQRRELLRERREYTKHFIEERRLLSDAHLEGILKREKLRRAREKLNRKQHVEEELKLKTQERQRKLKKAPSGVDRRYLDEAYSLLGRHVTHSNKQNVCTSSTVEKHYCIDDLAFTASKRHFGEMECWLDEREFFLGPYHKANGLALTSCQHKLEEEYRIQTVSKARWDLEADKCVFLFRKQQAYGDRNLPKQI